MNASLLWRLLLAHVVADFPLQPDALIAAKRKPVGLIIHAAFFCVSATMLTWPYIGKYYGLPLAIVGLTIFHGLVDWGKSAITKRYDRDTMSLFIADQLLHVISLFLVAYIFRFRPMRFISLYRPLTLGILAIWATPIVVNLGKSELTGKIILSDVSIGASHDKMGMLERLGLFTAGVAQGWFFLAALIIIPRVVYWFRGKEIGTTPILWTIALGLGFVANLIG